MFIIFTAAITVLRFKSPSARREIPIRIVSTIELSLGRSTRIQPRIPVTIAAVRISHHFPVPNFLESKDICILNNPSAKKIYRELHRENSSDCPGEPAL